MILVALALFLQTGTVVLDNEYVRVTRNAAPCAAPNVPGCADRVIVALGETELVAAGVRRTGTIPSQRAGSTFSSRRKRT